MQVTMFECLTSLLTLGQYFSTSIFLQSAEYRAAVSNFKSQSFDTTYRDAFECRRMYEVDKSFYSMRIHSEIRHCVALAFIQWTLITPLYGNWFL